MSAIRAGAVVIDVNDLESEAAFWSGLLSMDVTAREADWVDLGLLGEGGPVLSLQLVPERKSTKNRLHLDWLVDDFESAAARAVDLGATTVSPLHGEDRPWQVFADPEGNEFCLCSPA
ncbi:MAG: VOC family protein [Nocardioidaceae bacterium]